MDTDAGRRRPPLSRAALPRRPARIGRVARDEAELDRWSHFLTGDLHPAFFPLFSPQRYTTSQDAAALEAVKTAAQALIAKKLDLVDAHLAGKDHVLGGRRTFLDAYALPMLRWARAMLPGGLQKHRIANGCFVTSRPIRWPRRSWSTRGLADRPGANFAEIQKRSSRPVSDLYGSYADLAAGEAEGFIIESA